MLMLMLILMLILMVMFPAILQVTNKAIAVHGDHLRVAASLDRGCMMSGTEVMAGVDIAIVIVVA
jgi:hypothetical protein